MRQNIQIGKYFCKIYEGREAKKIIFWFVSEQRLEITDKVYDILRKAQSEITFALVAIGISDWNKELSPWPAPAAFGEEGFAGEGRELQKWLAEEGITKVLEQLELKKQDVELYVGGYSLAGLFALWTFYETGLFHGVASCSGSFWYPGWMEYVKTHTPREGSRIYISLGKKEEKVRNTTLSTIGNCTRELYQLYTKTKEVQEVVLEWNNGNHFAETEERMAKGFLWLLRKKVLLKEE